MLRSSVVRLQVLGQGLVEKSLIFSRERLRVVRIRQAKEPVKSRLKLSFKHQERLFGTKLAEAHALKSSKVIALEVTGRRE